MKVVVVAVICVWFFCYLLFVLVFLMVFLVCFGMSLWAGVVGTGWWLM